MVEGTASVTSSRNLTPVQFTCPACVKKMNEPEQGHEHHQDQHHDDFSAQASAKSDLPHSLGTSNHHFDNQQTYYHDSYPPSPMQMQVNNTPSSDSYLYTRSDYDYYPPAIPVDGFGNYFPNSYTKTQEFHPSPYSNPTHLAYMPGMPVQVNNFPNDSVSLGDSIASHPENQWQPNWNERGRTYHQPYRGKGKMKSQSRGRGYKNTHDYSHSYGQDGFYDRDDYYYEAPQHQYYNQRAGKRGGNIDNGRRGWGGGYQDTQFKLGDGDGKHHRRNNYGFQPDLKDAFTKNGNTAPTYKVSKNTHGHSSRHSKMLVNQVFDSQTLHGENEQGVHNDTGSLDSGKYTYNGKNKYESQKGIVQQVKKYGGETPLNSSKSDEFLVQESKEKKLSTVSSKELVSYSRGRGYDVPNMTRKEAGFTSRSADIKQYRTGVREYLSVQNDESQRATLSEQLSSSKYECMVCCDNIRPESAVWSCQNCYHVFHLSCIQKWAQSSLCKETKSWRCPGCQNVSVNIPSQYRCFCGSRRDPNYKRGDIAHSCGETCRKKRKDGCKHPCTILCHPGPCPPCCAMIWVTCECTKVRKHVRCSAVVAFKCDQVCDKPLNCIDHKCLDLCHTGLCSPCSVFKIQECFCKKMTRKAMCGTQDFMEISFCCEKSCGRTLLCGNHVCEEMCHPDECPPCSLMPGQLQSCCCGKTSLSQLEAPERQSCLDAVPTCQQICNKPMFCGSPLKPHLCERHCHTGDCGPCNKETSLKCLCGATEKKMACDVAVTYNEQNPFKCQRRCGKKKTCGRHKCSDNCCIKDIHICEIVCGQKLTCGLHKCEELCHRGNCKRCLQASFEELTCFCGAELLEPPVPCGTRPPECRRLCTRHHDCDHTVRHFCHFEDVCPRCTDLTDKMCMGGHMVRKNVPCHLTNISCGYPCSKTLPCGEHKCQKICHKGDCLDEGSVCVQLCEKLRQACGHPCGLPCHSGQCPDIACKTEIIITCPCGNRTAKALCSVGGDQSTELVQFQRLSVQSIVECGGQSVDLAQFAQTKKSNKRLDCDTNCAILERNRRLALVLEVKNPDMSAKLGNPTFTEFLKDYAKRNPKFALSIEKSFSDLVQYAKQSAHPYRSHAFQSMNREQRRFVHELAEFYGCQTQSYDYEPVKNVVATAVKDKCWHPNLTLSQHVLKDQLPKLPPPISSFKSQGVTFTVLERKKAASKDTPGSSRAWEEDGPAAPTSKQEPVVDYFDFTSP